MPGAGIKMVDMTASPAILLDVSRLVSRIGTGPLTGIDRVEAAWLAHIADHQHLLLCRVSRGQLLLPPAAGPVILNWITGDTGGLPARSGWRERLAGRSDTAARAMTALRRMAIASSGRDGTGVARKARALLPAGAAYLNVGHANLDRALLANLAGFRRAIMIHDTIPLDHPEYTREGQADKFRTRFMTAMSLADQIIAISDATAARIDLWRRRLAVTHRAPIMTAHIGTTLTPPDPSRIPADFDLSRPFFLALGTIEPRKNHALLLDVWDQLARRQPAGQIPQLFILGRRGWNNAPVFARLDRLPSDGPIVERAGLSDGAVAALLEKSHALLMPSRAEGFGLPLTEAAGRGIPVLCSPLPVAREILGDHATYLPPDAPDEWAITITQLASGDPIRMNRLEIPDWDSHFRRVARAISQTVGGKASG